MKFKLEELLSKKKYSDTYGQYIDCLTKSTEIDSCPKSWEAILTLRNVKIGEVIKIFSEDKYIPTYDFTDTNLLEMYCSIRPETNDSLFKLYFDRQLDVKFHYYINHNTSFYRPYILRWIDDNIRIDSKKKCIITNCSANKPYPDELHSAIKEKYPDYSLLVVTGVLGVVHELDFNNMVEYFSSLPNQKRVETEVIRWFKRNNYEEIIIMTEFNQQSFLPQLLTLQQDAKITNLFPTEHLTDYYVSKEFLKSKNII
jgi:hypothetical protein